MANYIANLVTPEFMTNWIIVALFILYVLYKELPGVTNKVKRRVKKEIRTDDIAHRVGILEDKVEDLTEKIKRDYISLNNINAELEHNRKMTNDSLEERSLIINGMLAVLKALQELGANGPTKQAEKDIEDFINKKAHE